MERSPLTPRPLVYAHRGDRSRAQDNTLEAFDLAVDARADGIELDVRRTRDGVLIVSHDPSIGDLAPFDQIGFEHLRSNRPEVPTLEEALRHIPSEVFVNVEVKHDPIDPHPDPDRSVAAETVRLIVEVDDPDRILLSSFDTPSVEMFDAVTPGMLRGQLVVEGPSFASAVSLTTHIGADAVHPPWTMIADDPGAHVSVAHDAGVAVVAWNANTPSDVEAAAHAGVDIIITDDPGMARQVVDRL